MIRKVLVGVAAAAFSFLLFLTVLTGSAGSALKSPNIKDWLSSSGIYSHAVDGMLKQSQGKPASEVGSVPLSDPSVQAAINNAFPPELLKNSAETLVDGTFRWLDGSVPKPDFSIDFTAAKTSLATSLGDYVRTRYNSLPACAARTLPASTDPFVINCRPVFGVNIDNEVSKVVNDIKNSQEFLPDSIIDGATYTGITHKPLYQEYEYLPDYYQGLGYAPYTLGVLALACAAVVIFGSKNRRLGTRRIAISLAVTGVIIFISIWLTNLASREAQGNIASSKDVDKVLQNDAIKVVDSAVKDINHSSKLFAVAFVVIATGLLLYLLLSRKSSLSSPESKKTHKSSLERSDKPAKE